MKKIFSYKIFLASPGDTMEERKIVEEVVKELNDTIGTANDLIIKLLKWENNAYPDLGQDPQDVINKKMGDDYDIFIGIMWKRFGTPSKRSDSGTKEEFDRAYNRFKNGENIKIMFYFNKSPLPQNFDVAQFEKVKEFKNQIGSLGLYWEYEGSNGFEKYLRRHITACIIDLHKNNNKESNQKNLRNDPQDISAEKTNNNRISKKDEDNELINNDSTTTINQKEIKDKIANGKVEAAIKDLLEITNEKDNDLHNSVIMQSSKYNRKKGESH